MKIQVLGSGCSTCQKLHQLVKDIVAENGGKDSVEYLTGDAGTTRIIELGIMSSPVLLVGDRVAMVGFIPDKNKIKAKIYGHI
ncbi:MAG: thioredoxin family protein [bacterium]